MKQNKKIVYLKHTVSLYAYLLIAWGFYRLLISFPEPFDELLVKPLVWLLPIIYLVRLEKGGWKDLGITSNNLFQSIYFALILGIIFGIEGFFVNFVKHGGLNFGANIGQSAFVVALGLSFITAVSEEIAFRGYLFNRVWQALDNEWAANLITSVGWVLIHTPIAIFDWKLALVPLIGYLILTAIFSIGAGFVFVRTRNILSSILLHVMWQWPIILFR